MPKLICKLIALLAAGLACAVLVELLTFRGWEHCPQIGTLICIVWAPLNMMVLGCTPRPRAFKHDDETIFTGATAERHS